MRCGSRLPASGLAALHPTSPAPPVQGTLRTYARLMGPCDPPAAIGLEMSASLQDGLPGPKEVRR